MGIGAAEPAEVNRAQARARIMLWTGAWLLAFCMLRSAFGIGDATIGEAFDRWGYNVVLAIGSVVVFLRARAKPEERGAWLVLGSSLAIWTIGNIYYATALWNQDPIPIPSLSDVCWLTLYPLSYLSLLMLHRTRGGRCTRADGSTV